MSRPNTGNQVLDTHDELAAVREQKEGARHDAEKSERLLDSAMEDIRRSGYNPDGAKATLERIINSGAKKERPVANPELGRALVEARARAGVSCLEVAKRMDTFHSGLQRLEEGRVENPDWTYLQQYAEAIGCRLKVTLEAQEEKAHVKA